jgi:branched-chain amino acid transport system substrate-binding protein
VATSGGQTSAITDYAAYVGGKPGKANSKLSPVTIGWINEQGGPSDLAPEATDGAEAAVAFLNSNASGIDGHPVKLLTCAVPDTVSSASACGQKMANNKDVVAIGTGAIGIGNAAMESALEPKKKPIVFNFALAPTDASYNPGFVLFGSNYTTEPPYAELAAGLHVHAVTLLYRQEPGVQLEIDNILAGFKAANIKVLHTVGYNENATDLISPLEASDYRDAGLIVWPEGSVSGCSDIYKAIQTLSVNVPVASAVPCNDPQVASADGGSLPAGWYYLSATDVYDPTTAEGSGFLKVMTQVGKAKEAGDAWVEDSFSQVLTIAKWYGAVLSAGKALTPANVAAAGKADKGGVPFGAPHLVCGVYASIGLPNLCSNETLFVRYVNGKFVKVLGGWQGEPKGFVPVLK